jgi:hypothetical protein
MVPSKVGIHMRNPPSGVPDAVDLEPSMSQTPHFKPYAEPSGGWDLVRSVGNIFGHEGVPASGAHALTRQNKPTDSNVWALAATLSR